MSKQSKTSTYTGRGGPRKIAAADRGGVVRFKCGFTNTILDVLRGRGWQEVPSDSSGGGSDWDIYWCDVIWMKEYFDHSYLEEHMKLCHFRNHYELTRKNLMVKNLKRMRKQIEREHGKVEAQKCDFFPTTFEVPSEYHIFVEEFKKKPGQIWIMKPVAKAQGKGIFLFRKLKDIIDWKKGETFSQPSDPNNPGPETYVVQRYIDDPYLIGGRKFDLRVYVLVTSYVPLRAWLYRGGFARFSNTRFSLDSIDDNYVHLTNVAIQKTAPDYDPEKGCKWSVRQLRGYLTAHHGVEAVERCFRAIDDIFVKSLQSVQKTMINDKHCFELYGYDILLNRGLKPWLIEVNASPSLTASSKEDYDLKYGLLDDVMNVIDMEGRLTGKERRVGGFDMIWDDGPVMFNEGGIDTLSNPAFLTNSFLGCWNDRKLQLKRLYKSLQLQATKKAAAAAAVTAATAAAGS
ncbi:putative tubulin polyglutamylase TTLL9 [Tubulanus polymorphus]|uniref:putative tubulin polyglutamylase TTLL9 n=1 Tax=Tubulanus polymorphus TaxID=672921 RepID=UPI003DA56200